MDQLLEKLLKRVDPYKKIPEHRVFLVWEECVGQTIANNAKPHDIDRGVLLVHVRTPAWSQQLSMNRAELKKKLNKKLGRSVIKDIRFRLGEVKDIKPQAKPVEASDPVELSPQKIREIDEQVEQIKDTDVRKQVKRTLIAAAKRNNF